MNRYQLAVEAIDRKHRSRMRMFSWLGAASLTIVVLWSAGVRPLAWFDGARSIPADDKPRASIRLPLSGTSSEPVVIHREPLPGLDSSISLQPQRLHLVATSPGRNASEGTARIGTHVENPQTYVAGAILANGARLLEIHADRVALERNGKRLTLRLSSDQSKSLAKRSEGFDELAMVGGVPMPTSGPTSGLTSASTPEITLARDTVAEVVRSMPFYENNQQIGVQVFPGQQSGVFSRLGLQAGDVLVTANGVPLVNPADAERILQQLGDGAALTVTVRRGDGTESHSLDGSVVAKVLEASRHSATALSSDLH